MKTWRGFSLVELIVGVAILGVLLAIAMPAFSNWLRNAKVRTAAESVQNGLQLARAEAVRRNTTVGFRLVDRADESCALIANDLSTSVWNWVVSIRSPAGKCQIAPVAEDADPSDDALADNPFIIQSRSGAEGSSAATLKTNQSALVFNSLGRLTQVPPLPPGSPAGSIPHVRIEVESATGEPCRADDGPIRCLWIMVTLGGQIRMCDPALAASDAQGGVPMKQPPNTDKAQAGVMLLEALIGILIFSLGILSLVALQATSIQLTSDAKYRTDASLLANRLIGQMWASGLTTADLQAKFSTACTDCDPDYIKWLDDVQGIDGLPGVIAASSGVDSTLPTVTVENDGQVTIDMRWRTPQMPTSGDRGISFHRHIVVSQIVRNL